VAARDTSPDVPSAALDATAAATDRGNTPNVGHDPTARDPRPDEPDAGTGAQTEAPSPDYVGWIIDDNDNLTWHGPRWDDEPDSWPDPWPDPWRPEWWTGDDG